MKTQGYWADLSRHDFARLDAASTIAILPIGAIEQHGPHLPVSRLEDYYLPYNMLFHNFLVQLY